MEPNSDDVEVWEFESDSESEHPYMTSAMCGQSHNTVNCGVTSEHVETSILKLVGFISTFLFSWQAVFRVPHGALNVLFNIVFEKMHKITESENVKIL